MPIWMESPGSHSGALAPACTQHSTGSRTRDESHSHSSTKTFRVSYLDLCRAGGGETDTWPPNRATAAII